jgi:hypothetical protein
MRGGASAVTGAEVVSEGSAHTREAVASAVAIGLGRKMTGRGPRVSERAAAG